MSNAENPQIYGVWKAYKSENFAAVLDKAGAPWMAKKMAANATPTVKIEKIDDKIIRISSKAMMWTVSTDHEIDNIAEMDMPNQGKQHVFTQWEDGRLVCFMGPPGSDVKSSGIKQIRSIESNGEMLLTMKHGDVTAYRWFKRE